MSSDTVLPIWLFKLHSAYFAARASRLTLRTLIPASGLFTAVSFGKTPNQRSLPSEGWVDLAGDHVSWTTGLSRLVSGAGPNTQIFVVIALHHTSPEIR